MTLNEIKVLFEEFGADHYMIGTTLYGLPEKVDTTNTNGFVMWFYNNGVDISETSQEVKMQVAFMDVLNKNMDNEKDALSDCDRLLEDFSAFLDTEQYYEDFQYVRTLEMSNFLHTHGSDYIGVSAEFTLALPLTYDYCEAAIPEPNGLLDNIVAHFSLTDTSNSAVTEDAGFADGILNDSPTKSGSDYCYDGVSEYWTIRDNAALTFLDAKFTFSIWIKQDNIGGFMLYKGTTSFDREYYMTTNANGFVAGIFDYGYSTKQTLVSGSSISDGQWHHCVFAGDGNYLYNYVDGVLKAKEAIQYQMINTGSFVYVGRYGGSASTSWEGCNKYLGIWSAKLTDGGVSVGEEATGQIATLYNNGSPFEFSEFDYSI